MSTFLDEAAWRQTEFGLNNQHLELKAVTGELFWVRLETTSELKIPMGGKKTATQQTVLICFNSAFPEPGAQRALGHRCVVSTMSLGVSLQQAQGLNELLD